MRNRVKCGLLMTLFTSPFSHAIGISSMVEFAKNGEGNFTITNSADYRQFIQVAISSVSVVDGQLEKQAYSRDNIDRWSLSVRPARTVIDSGLKKNFSVVYQPKPFEAKDRDKIYQLTFVPTPYFSEGQKEKQVMQIAVGFAPIFVVPADNDQPLSYQVSHNQESIQLKNNGNSYIRAFFNGCGADVKSEDRDQCSKVVYGLAGRDLTVSLLPEMKKAASIRVEFSTHNLSYKKAFVLQPGQTVKG